LLFSARDCARGRDLTRKLWLRSVRPEAGFFRDHAVLSRRRKEGATMQLAALKTVLIGLAISAAALIGSASAQPLDKVTFGSNWVAEAEHGGFYQALADGTYKKYGLDVTILPGGPNANNRMLLLVDKIDFYLSANTLQGFDAVAHDVPTVQVAALFQKDPQVLIAHPNAGVASFADLKKLTLFVSKEGMATYFQWLKADFGFKEDQVKPYTFNPQPFLADRRSAMQGYVTSEPFAVERQGHFTPLVFLLADQGFSAYSTLIETRRDLVEKKPDLVQRFVDASIIGWYNYIYGDNKAANALIKEQNPEMTDDLLSYSVAEMKEYGIVDSGDALTLGVGAMTDARMKDFFDKMVRAGVVQAGLDYRKSYTLQFINKKVGLDLRPKP
jgi:NitT/TauT family transport system substrate-binding protein